MITSNHPVAILVTPREACHLLGVGNTKLYDLLKSGKLRRVKLGSKSTRIPLADIHALVNGGV
jgi:excisionase family DNA binding protein